MKTINKKENVSKKVSLHFSERTWETHERHIEKKKSNKESPKITTE